MGEELLKTVLVWQKTFAVGSLRSGVFLVIIREKGRWFR